MNIEKIFTRDTIARTLETLPEIKTPIVDSIYKRRKQHPLAIIGVEDIKKTIKNVPVVRRGSSAYKPESRVFCETAGAKFAGKSDADGFRHAKPHLARDHAGSEIGRTEPG